MDMKSNALFYFLWILFLLVGPSAFAEETAPQASNPTIQIEAGPDQIVDWSTPASLEGKLDLPPEADTRSANLKIQWSIVNGPAKPRFAQPHKIRTLTTFPKAGSYLIRLMVEYKGQVIADVLTIEMLPPKEKKKENDLQSENEIPATGADASQVEDPKEMISSDDSLKPNSANPKPQKSNTQQDVFAAKKEIETAPGIKVAPLDIGLGPTPEGLDSSVTKDEGSAAAPVPDVVPFLPFASGGGGINNNLPQFSKSLQLNFSQVIGGIGDEKIQDVVVDPDGNILLTGSTQSEDFPVTENAAQKSFAGNQDAFVMKLNPEGQVIWSTYLGGKNFDGAQAVAVNPSGEIYVGGQAGEGFAITEGAFQTEFGGDEAPNPDFDKQDGFIAKFSPEGILLWSTYLGGTGSEFVQDLAADESGAYFSSIVKTAVSFVKENAIQNQIKGKSDGLIAKLDKDGKSIVYATYLGGSDEESGVSSVQIDQIGNAYLLLNTASDDMPASTKAFQKKRKGQRDLFLAKYSPKGDSLMYTNYFGGSADEILRENNLIVDVLGQAYIAAATRSDDLPVTFGVMQTGLAGSDLSESSFSDGFVAKVSTDGQRLISLTYLGGSGDDEISGIDVNENGEIFLSGRSASGDLPITIQDPTRPANSDDDEIINGGILVPGNSEPAAFVAKLSSDFSRLVYCAKLNGGFEDSASSAVLNPSNQLIVSGTTQSENFPKLNSDSSLHSQNSEGWVAGFQTNK
jgi:hypothetical protein